MYPLPPSPETNMLRFAEGAVALYFKLSAVAGRMHEDLGLTGGMRAMLRELFLDGHQTAPEIARRKSVSRQAVQPHLDGLVRLGFVRSIPNPRHKRSKLYEVTPRGIDVCVTMQGREIAKLKKAAAGFDPADVRAGLRTIEAMNKALTDYLDGRLED